MCRYGLRHLDRDSITCPQSETGIRRVPFHRDLAVDDQALDPGSGQVRTSIGQKSVKPLTRVLTLEHTQSAQVDSRSAVSSSTGPAIFGSRLSTKTMLAIRSMIPTTTAESAMLNIGHGPTSMKSVTL